MIHMRPAQKSLLGVPVRWTHVAVHFYKTVRPPEMLHDDTCVCLLCPTVSPSACSAAFCPALESVASLVLLLLSLWQDCSPDQSYPHEYRQEALRL